MDPERKAEIRRMLAYSPIEVTNMKDQVKKTRGEQEAEKERARQEQEAKLEAWRATIARANVLLEARRLELEKSYDKPLSSDVRDPEVVAKFLSDRYNKIQVTISYEQGQRTVRLSPTAYAIKVGEQLDYHLEANAKAAQKLIDDPAHLATVWPSLEEVEKTVSIYMSGFHSGQRAAEKEEYGGRRMGPFGPFMFMGPPRGW